HRSRQRRGLSKFCISAAGDRALDAWPQGLAWLRMPSNFFGRYARRIDETSMATARLFDFMRNANTKSIVLAVGLACACVFSGAHAQQRCANLNYDESRVGDYTVPDPLLSKDGKRITDPALWKRQRRGEILQDFRDLMYGHTPELPIKLRGQA